MRYRPNQIIVGTKDDLAAAHKFLDRIEFPPVKEGEKPHRFVVTIKKFEDDASTAQKNLFHMWWGLLPTIPDQTKIGLKQNSSGNFSRLNFILTKTKRRTPPKAWKSYPA